MQAGKAVPATDKLHGRGEGQNVRSVTNMGSSGCKEKNARLDPRVPVHISAAELEGREGGASKAWTPVALVRAGVRPIYVPGYHVSQD